MPNELIHETSPYLLQHANNPVNWYPWGPEALARARAEDKPIFLSIGYSACHWCHVMEHESFENEQIARQLNDGFVCIKVDREERPDLDQIYMHAVQLLTGRGGWPMSVFLTPELEPFYGGTYFPPTARMGMPGFDQLLTAVLQAWRDRRDSVRQEARQLTEHLRAEPARASGGGLDRAPLEAAARALARIFDSRNGGFGGAPKFPHPIDMRLLLRLWHRGGEARLLDIVTFTLDKMAAGGIYDHLGGGFHRYSVDERWLVPHFEKMLYDNALLAGCYLEAWQATGRAGYERVLRESLDYVLREMTGPEAGFFSTQDADSEGVEGKFYVWTPAEVREVLGEPAAREFCYAYDVSEEGNFEDQNILNLPKTIEQSASILGRDPGELSASLAEARAKLLPHRNRRVWPGLDDKVLVSWNGLMIESLARAGAALVEPRYLEAAQAAARFILERMARPDGRLLHSWRSGRARFDAYLDDYACLADALVTLYECSRDERWIDEAVRLVDMMLAHFADSSQGGFFYTADDHEALVARQKDVQDSSVPSGNAMAATVLLRLGKLCGRGDYLSAAQGTLESVMDVVRRHPTATAQSLIALDFFLGPTPELVFVSGEDAGPSGGGAKADAGGALDDILRRVHRLFWPNKVLAGRPGSGCSPALAGIFEGKAAQGSEVSLYVCENFACREPLVGAAAALAECQRLAGRSTGPELESPA